MSSKIRIVKMCEYCEKEFIAKKTISKCCSDNCSTRFYKLKIKNDKIALAALQTEIKRKPKAFVTEKEISDSSRTICNFERGSYIIKYNSTYFKKMDFSWEDEWPQSWKEVSH